MITLYYAEILCHAGTVVLKTIVCSSAKQAAAIATNIVNQTPPAAGFNIRKQMMDARSVASLVNNKG